MKIDFENIISNLKNKANSIFNDNGKLNTLIMKTKDIINENNELNNVLDDIKMLIQLIKDYKSHRYTGMSKNSIIMIVISLIYLVNPIDLIPDFLIGGFIDDAAVIAYVLKKVQVELKQYKVWKNETTMEDDNVIEVEDVIVEDDTDGYFDIEI